MTIHITDEMIYAFAGEPEITATDAHAIEVGLRAALAIVERDYLRVDGVHRDGRRCRPGNRCVYCGDAKQDELQETYPGSGIFE